MDQETLGIVFFISAIISVVIIIMIVSRLGAIKKNQERTNILLYKLLTEKGIKFTDDELRRLNS